MSVAKISAYQGSVMFSVPVVLSQELSVGLVGEVGPQPPEPGLEEPESEVLHLR